MEPNTKEPAFITLHEAESGAGEADASDSSQAATQKSILWTVAAAKIEAGPPLTTRTMKWGEVTIHAPFSKSSPTPLPHSAPPGQEYIDPFLFETGHFESREEYEELSRTAKIKPRARA